MRPFRPIYDTPEHGAEVAIFAILVVIFGLLVAMYNWRHDMSPDTCRMLGLISCSQTVIRTQPARTP